MPQNYTPEFKKKIVRLHEEEGRTYKSMPDKPGNKRRIRLYERKIERLPKDYCLPKDFCLFIHIFTFPI